MDQQGQTPPFETPFSASPTLEDLRKMVTNFATERDWHQYHTPRNLCLALVGEVGELAECFQWKGEVQPGLNDWSEKEKTLRKIGMNAAKYPADRVKGSDKKYNEYTEPTGTNAKQVNDN